MSPRIQTTVRDSTGQSTTSTTDFVYDAVPSDYDRIISGDMAGGFTVPEGQAWKIDGVVETDGNVIVEGLLAQRPGDWLDFKEVDESMFEGGGMEPKPNDTGLWIMGPGTWDICGTPKAAWNRTGDDPTWSDSDELLSAPQAIGDYKTFTPFARGSAVPQITDPWGTVRKTEILNMTRDCGLRGLADGRVHVFIHSDKPQRICHCLIQHVGPRKDGKKIVGRWGLHWHHTFDGSRGSLAEGVLIRDCGTHAFVPHASHGVTLRQTIAFDFDDDAYWGDLVSDDPLTASDDVLHDQIMAARGGHKGTNANIFGWFAAAGKNVLMKDSVMVGVGGSPKSNDPAGYGWIANQGAAWELENNVAHNCAGSGSWLYQNPTESGEIKGLTIYHCGKAGIDHGAYKNAGSYQDPVSFGNPVGLRLKAVAAVNSAGDPLRFLRGRFQGSQVAVLIEAHQTNFREAAGELVECDLRAPKLVVIDEGKWPGWYRFIRCFNGETDRDIAPADVEIRFAHPTARHQFQGRGDHAWEFYFEEGVWKTRDIPAFA